jgi:hypothetical protein
MDFFRIRTKEGKKGGLPEVYPEYIVGRSKDLMVQGKSFYAVWDKNKGLWSRDEYDVQLLVDEEIRQYIQKSEADGIPCIPVFLRDFDTNRWNQFQKFMKNISDNSHPLDTKVTFANTEVKKTDYASRRLPYNLAPGDISAWDELMSVLYDSENREKIEWAIGAVLSGDAKKIEKFLVFYGKGGTGKSTVMHIIFKLFGGKVKDGGYCAMFDAKALTNGSSFATEAFKDNPLVAIQHDGDLSRIEDNTQLNSIVSHEEMRINEKYKATYDTKINAFLFMGTNNPVQITDAKSGIIRRLIDVNPTGALFEPAEYYQLMDRIDFQLGAIADHCLKVYKKLGRSHYSDYEPLSMMMKTDQFFNFIEAHFDLFKEQDYTSLKQAWSLYKAYRDEAELKYSFPLIAFREKLKDYFREFKDRHPVDGVITRSVYVGFTAQPYKKPVSPSKPNVYSLVMDSEESILDEMYAGMPAQYGKADETPRKYWTDDERMIKGVLRKPRPDEIVSTVLGDLDTKKLHFLKLPEYHIVIDFDLKGDDGKKSLEKSLEAASSWPATYAELSKSGNGVHLHYIWDGDSSELATRYSEDIEIKVYRGNGSLRRRLTKCNNVAVATINSGLPFREKKVHHTNILKTEKGLRALIQKNLEKGVHNGTKPSIDFIVKILNDAYNSGMVYDVSDMEDEIMAFANNSEKNAPYCLKQVLLMQFKGDENATPESEPSKFRDDRIVFFDCEVYENLFVVCWKYHGDETCTKMINPSPADIEKMLTTFKLVGFYNRSYDNHILWARMLGANNEQLYALSQRLVSNDNSAKFGEAWNASYADVYDFSSDKKSLKKWEIELGLKHMEMDIPWDEPVPDDRVMDVVEYCCNDVIALEAVFEHCKGDYLARQILSQMSGKPVNASTRTHAIEIIFGKDKEPQKKFVYTDLSELFPGYTFDPYNKLQKSSYMGEDPKEGGYVYAEPGIYENVALLDIESMHPTSIEQLNLFGPYTEIFSKLKEARLALKHGDFTRASELLNIEVTEENAPALDKALKLVINSIYGYTSATFMNPFRDPRNIDNIVAKRGALFMVTLKHALKERNIDVIHIKTDSVKIPNATPEDIEFIKEFGAKYGYNFDLEATYKKLCLVNDAVYIAYEDESVKKGKIVPAHWTATGAEFKHPYVFKKLFSGEPISFRDLCETKQVAKGAMYLYFGESEPENKDDKLLRHIGKSGMFVAIAPDNGRFQGGKLLCLRDDKFNAVNGTRNYLWAEAEMLKVLENGAIERMCFERMEDAVEGTGSIADIIDISYYENVSEEAKKSVEKFGNFDEFVSV